MYAMQCFRDFESFQSFLEGDLLVSLLGLLLCSILLGNLCGLFLLDGGINLGSPRGLVSVAQGSLPWVRLGSILPRLLLLLVLLLGLDPVGEGTLVLVVDVDVGGGLAFVLLVNVSSDPQWKRPVILYRFLLSLTCLC